MTDAQLEEMPRLSELDCLRGLLLVLMTVTHLPTRFSAYSHDFFGFVSAAEGFVFLSAFLAAVIHTRKARSEGWPTVRRHLHKRSLKLYAYHVLLLAFAFALASIFADRPALVNLLSFYFDQPRKALMASPLLLYCPPLFDILPMYVLFLAVTPSVLQLAERRGFALVLGASTLLWGVGQLGVRAHVHRVLDRFLDGFPASATGAFDLFGWQLLWVLGLLLGASSTVRVLIRRPPRATLALALAVALGFLLLRHLDRALDLGLGDTFLLDKWRFAPLRILNLATLTVLAIHYGPRLGRWARWARLGLLERLGRASLRVFCAHIVLCLLAFLVVGDADQDLPLWVDVSILAITFAVLVWIAGRRAPGLAPQRAGA